MICDALRSFGRSPVSPAVPASAQLRSATYVSGLTSPVAFVQDPSNASLQYVVELGGVIRVIQNGTLLPTPFATISPIGHAAASAACSAWRSRRTTRRAGASTSASRTPPATSSSRACGDRRVTRSSSDGIARSIWSGRAAEPFITHPFGNHNGGNIAFGPDGYLYIGMGDGGGGNDPITTRRIPATLLGKMLRIDVVGRRQRSRGLRRSRRQPVHGPGRLSAEIWSIGWRNPWRWSFDDPSLGGTGALVVGDVGQGAREEIDYEPAGRGGRNYGWRNREGTLDTNISRTCRRRFRR